MRTTWIILLALGLAPAFAEAAPPEQVHVSVVGDQIGVSWARPGDARASTRDVVEFRFDEPNQTRQARPERVRWIAPDVTIHTALIPQPSAAGRLEYRVGSDEGDWSEWLAVPLGPAHPAGTWRFLAYGDHGTGADGNASTLLPGLAQAERPNAVLHLGDLSYANGRPPTWDTWFRMIEPVASRAFYMAAPGNHEHEGFYPATGPYTGPAPPGSGLHPYEQFVERFAYARDELSYSFHVGPVHVLVINSEAMCVQSDAQHHVPWRVNPPCQADGVNRTLLDWAERELAANAHAAWTFAMFHRPVYSSGAYAPGEPTLQAFFVPLFEKYGVDLVLSGHDHTYQRSFPLRGGRPTTTERFAYEREAGPIYLVSGGAGEGLYSWSCCGANSATPPDWTAERARRYHYLRIDVREEGLRVESLAIQTAEVLDSFVMGAFAPTPASSDPGPVRPGAGVASPGIIAAGGALAAVVVLLARSRR